MKKISSYTCVFAVCVSVFCLSVVCKAVSMCIYSSEQVEVYSTKGNS